MDYKNKVSDFLKHCTGNTTDVLFELYSIIEKYEYREQVLAFQFFCENFYSIDSDKSYIIKKRYFTDEQLQISYKRINGINRKIDEIVYLSNMNNDSPFEFYHKVWDLITSNKICKSKRDRALSLLFIMENNLIPYMNVGYGLQMKDSDYKNTIESIDRQIINRVKYIINLDFEQKTQRCSLLLDNILSVKDKNQQIIILSVILDAHWERMKKKISKQIKRL